MEWERVSDEWHETPIEAEGDPRSLNDRAFALMAAWIDASCLNNGRPTRLKVEYGLGYDGVTDKPICAVIRIVLNGGHPIQFTVKEVRWAMDQMREHYDNQAEEGVPLASDEDHRRDLDSFLATIELSASEAEKLDPKNVH